MRGFCTRMSADTDRPTSDTDRAMTDARLRPKDRAG